MQGTTFLSGRGDYPAVLREPPDDMHARALLYMLGNVSGVALPPHSDVKPEAAILAGLGSTSRWMLVEVVGHVTR